jgi:hypothetical protein
MKIQPRQQLLDIWRAVARATVELDRLTVARRDAAGAT